MEDIKTLRHLQELAEQVALTLEQCNSVDEVITMLQDLQYNLLTWKAGTCYVDGEKKPLGGACKLFEYWTRETVDAVIYVDWRVGAVIVQDKSVAYRTGIAPLSKRIRTLIGRY